jgi:NADH-quinone oxidoreductase subunit J
MAAARASIPDVVTFVVSASIILAGAIGVVLSRNPVHAALSLVMTLLGIAVLFVEEQADFIAAVQVIVYAGAIVVLFLFVIMFLGVDREENLREPLRAQRPLAIVVVVVAMAGVIALAATAHWVTGAHGVVGPISTPHRSEVAQLGVELFTRYLYAFEATAGLLVIAVVGAVVLARRPPGPIDDSPGEAGADARDPAAGDVTADLSGPEREEVPT